MSFLRRFGSVAIALLICPPLMAAPATQPLLADQVAHLLKELDSDSYPDRQAAIEAAGKLPVEALPLLQAAEQKPDISPDVRLDLDTVIANLQQIAKKRSKYQTLYEFYHRHLTGEYNRVGKKNPAWDDVVRQMLDATAKRMADSAERRDAVDDTAAFSEAVSRTRCDDPLVQLLQVRSSKLSDQSKQDAVAAAIQTSDYSSLVKLWSMQWMAELMIRSSSEPADRTTKAEAYLKQAIGRWTDALRDDPAMPAGVVLDHAESQLQSAKFYGLDRNAIWKTIDTSLAKTLPEESLVRLNLKGWYLVESAWDLRNDPATADLPETIRAYDDRLNEAEKVLGRAYELYPDDPHAATTMLSQVRAQNAGRPSMEVWFSRAMKADPENYAACQEKLWFLEVPWNGTKEDRLAFGRQCLEGGQFDTEIPLMVVETHDAMATPGPWAGEPVRPYFAQDDVWRDIAAAFDGFLDQHPDAWRQRARYANYAWLAGNLQAAIDQYTAIEAAPMTYRKSDLLRVLKLSQAMHLAGTAAADPTARRVARQQRDMADFKHLMLDGYDRVGKKNPKWDATARAAITAAAKDWGNDPDCDFGQYDVMLEASKQAIDAGCDDPLVRFIYSNSVDSYLMPDGPAGVPIGLADGMALAKSEYPAFLRLRGAMWAASFHVWRKMTSDAERSKVHDTLEAGMAAIEQTAAEHSIDRSEISIEISDLARDILALGDNPEEIRQQIAQSLAAGHADPLTIKAADLNLQTVAMDYVDRNDMPNFRKDPSKPNPTYDLHDIERQWETIWQADPTEPYAAQRILYLSRQLHSDRAWIDFWFHEAIRADPASCDTAELYLDELQWAGDDGTDLERYADQCGGMADYRSQIPFVEMMYLDRIARHDKKPGEKPDAAYLTTTTVWPKVAALYEGYLSKFPLDTRRRSEYASYACLTGRWVIAAQQLKLLGDRVKVKAFYSQDRLDACRKHVAGLENAGFLPTTQPEQ